MEKIKNYIISKLLGKHTFKVTDLVISKDTDEKEACAEVQALLWDHNYRPVLGLYNFINNTVYVAPENQFNKHKG